MKLIALLLLVCASVPAQTLSFFIRDTTGATPDTPLPSTYQLTDTAVGNSSNLVLGATNVSSFPVMVAQIYVTEAYQSTVLSQNFSITGLNQSGVLAPGSTSLFTVHFAPRNQGPITAYLQDAYAIQQNGCSLTSNDPTVQCPATFNVVSTFTGTALAPQLVLSYNSTTGSVALQPNSSSPLNFGNVSTSATQTLTFTLSNQASYAINTPAVALQNQVYTSSSFQLDASSLPAVIGPGSSATFTVTFAPGQIGLASATLTVGSNSYPIVGTGVVVSDVDALSISYVDSTGVRTLPQAATPINFGQLIAGTNTTSTLTFTVTNPSSSLNAVSIQTLSATGNGFTLSGGPSIPASIAPGQSITFQVTFANPGPTGKYTGTLSIGTRQFSLSGQTIASLVPTPTFQVSEQPLTSQQQVNLTIQIPVASTVTAIGTLTMQFVPSVANVSDDPAVLFLATSGRALSVSIATGSQSVTYQGQSSIGFQTGTTAGTLTFTIAFPNSEPYSQSFTISPAQVQITSGKAVRQSPNLVVTLSGYDNTYSAGQLSFTFYDTSGKAITPNAIQVNAASNFHQYFFTNNQAGGAFALQASFPVNGDVTQVGSVSVGVANSVGQATSTQNFQ